MSKKSRLPPKKAPVPLIVKVRQKFSGEIFLTDKTADSRLIDGKEYIYVFRTDRPGYYGLMAKDAFEEVKSK